MPPERERAYWYLLYRLMITLRLQSGGGILACFFPVYYWRRSQCIFDLVDLFHNLPMFGARGWEGFDEEYFWKYIARYQALHTDDKHDYREIFERHLTDEKAR